MKYIATVKHCDQVSPEHGQFFTDAKILVGTETIDDVMNWAEKFCGPYNKNFNVKIIKESE